MTTMTLNGKTFEVDDEIASIVHALNAAGIPTVASCSGHGMRPGRISLADGRELFVLPSYEIGQWFETQFPRDINGQTKEERAADEPGEAQKLLQTLMTWAYALDAVARRPNGNEGRKPMNSPSTERYYAEMESARNEAEDAYFKARPQLSRTLAEQSLFRAGFERGFSLLWNRMEEQSQRDQFRAADETNERLSKSQQKRMGTQAGEPMGRCCYGGFKPRSHCSSCAAWEQV